MDTDRMVDDLLTELNLLTDLDPNLHIQLKALEDEHHLYYGYEKMGERMERLGRMLSSKNGGIKNE